MVRQNFRSRESLDPEPLQVVRLAAGAWASAAASAMSAIAKLAGFGSTPVFSVRSMS
jgi:hypothetical protein